MAKQRENWKLILAEQRKLKSEGASLIYKRVQLLVKLYEDQEFLGWCADNGKNELDELDDELSDVGFDFLTLKAVLDAFPDETDWRRQSLRLLVAEVLKKTKRERTRETKSWKERALAAEKEVEQLRGEINVATARMSEMESLIKVLREDRELRLAKSR